jgi:hypothetical protein
VHAECSGIAIKTKAKKELKKKKKTGEPFLVMMPSRSFLTKTKDEKTLIKNYL